MHCFKCDRCLHSTLPLLSTVVVTMGIHEKKALGRKWWDCCLCFHPLPSPWPLPHSFFPFLQTHILSSVNKGCVRHTCPAPGAAMRKRHPQSSCTVQVLLPVLILSPECNFTSLPCLLTDYPGLFSPRDHRMNSYLLAFKTWFSPAMWPVVPHRGMIQHEETPGSNKKQAIRGVCLQPSSSWYRHTPCLSFRDYTESTEDMLPILYLIYEEFSIKYQMWMIHSGSGEKVCNHSSEESKKNRWKDEKQSAIRQRTGS